jgi:hypothetical protein
MRPLIIILIFVSANLFCQTKTDKPYFLTDTVYTKQNLVHCKAEFISIEHFPVGPCGFFNDWTIGEFKIISVDNKNIEVGKTYTFYIPCGAVNNNDKPIKGKIYSLAALIKFPENDSALSYLNSFKKDHPDRLYLGRMSTTP